MVFPPSVDIIEVGPRDGFQNVKTFIPTELKISMISDMLAAGIREMEITSFTSPKAIPQLADSAEVAAAVVKNAPAGARIMALVPNLRGAENALKAGIRDITYVISASEGHNQANVRRSIAESLEGLRELTDSCPDAIVRLDAATVFGCPFEGRVEEAAVFALMDAALERGVKEIVLCDTIGVANPKQVYDLSVRTRERIGAVPLALHLHDTRGLGLANMLAAMEAGVTRFETSLGGLGGCPFAPGASGNTASEDALNMLEQMGIATGVDLNRYLKVVAIAKENIDPALMGHMIRACGVKI
jgi:hydroxymethylglutaryl-CoA lyase